LDRQIEGPCAHREDEPTVLCISLLGLVQRTREHAVQRFHRRTGPCIWVAQSQQLLDYGRKLDHFRREQVDKTQGIRCSVLLCEISSRVILIGQTRTTNDNGNCNMIILFNKSIRGSATRASGTEHEARRARHALVRANDERENRLRSEGYHKKWSAKLKVNGGECLSQSSNKPGHWVDRRG
jgi:hypothetical protein